MQQGRDDIIVKVNLQSPIPISFYITVANLYENDARMRLFLIHYYIIPTLFAYFLACQWHPYILLHFQMSVCSILITRVGFGLGTRLFFETIPVEEGRLFICLYCYET